MPRRFSRDEPLVLRLVAEDYAEQYDLKVEPITVTAHADGDLDLWPWVAVYLPPDWDEPGDDEDETPDQWYWG